MSLDFSYRHLYYFWVVAKEGGMAKAAGRLGMAVQTVSAQVRELERALGQQLLRPAGRGLALTEAGHAALRQADQIFSLGEQLPALVRDAVAAPQVRLAVGISDGLSKLLVRQLLQPVMATPQLRLLCHEDEFDRLLADLALHRLDVVLSDRPAPVNRNLKVYSHPVGSSALAWYAPPALLAQARVGFPQNLAALPVLLPTGHAAVRPRLDAWFEERFISTFTLEDLGRNPAGSVGRQLYDHMAELGLSPELMHQRMENPQWAPESDFDYFTLRTGQTHDMDHLLGEVGFDVIAEIFPTGLRTGNMFAHVGPALAGELLRTNTMVIFPWFMRCMMNYPEAWPMMWHNLSHGYAVGQQSDMLFTAKMEDVWHLSPAEARDALGVRGWKGPNDSRAASRIFGEGYEII